MATLFPGRYTAKTDEPYVVFVIGMRVNRVLAFHKWMSVAGAMPPMLKELYQNKELGFLSGRTLIAWREVMVFQFWRSFEHLNAYAHKRDAKHLPAWAAFNRKVGSEGSVGIWHETYQVQANQSEVIYVNMPRYGLAEWADHIPAKAGLSAQARMAKGA